MTTFIIQNNLGRAIRGSAFFWYRLALVICAFFASHGASLLTSARPRDFARAANFRIRYLSVALRSIQPDVFKDLQNLNSAGRYPLYASDAWKHKARAALNHGGGRLHQHVVSALLPYKLRFKNEILDSGIFELSNSVFHLVV